MSLPGELTVTDVFAQCPASTAKTAMITDATQLLADLDTAVSATVPPGTGKLTDSVRACLKGDFLLWLQNVATALDA
jgi:hypothetical protein